MRRQSGKPAFPPPHGPHAGHEQNGELRLGQPRSPAQRRRFAGSPPSPRRKEPFAAAVPFGRWPGTKRSEGVSFYQRLSEGRSQRGAFTSTFRLMQRWMPSSQPVPATQPMNSASLIRAARHRSAMRVSTFDGAKRSPGVRHGARAKIAGQPREMHHGSDASGKKAGRCLQTAGRGRSIKCL
jgi:hypothetical protein